jgi:hypothetical protein
LGVGQVSEVADADFGRCVVCGVSRGTTTTCAGHAGAVAPNRKHEKRTREGEAMKGTIERESRIHDGLDE